MPDVHETEVTGAKIYHITDENVINIVSAEAKGRVYKVEEKDMRNASKKLQEKQSK